MGREIQGERIDEVPGGRLKILLFREDVLGPWEFHLNAEAEPSVEALRTMEEEVAAAAQTVGLTMGVLLGGQVQCGVSRIQIGKSPLAVADTAHHDLTEDRGQAPVPTRLRPAAGHTGQHRRPRSGAPHAARVGQDGPAVPAGPRPAGYPEPPCEPARGATPTRLRALANAEDVGVATANPSRPATSLAPTCW
jgi:hypothetical protein